MLVETVGPGWAIALDAATFLGSAALLSRLRLTRADRGRASFLTELRDGWGEFARRTWVWASVANFGLFQLIVLSSWLVLGPYVADTELGGAGAWATILVAGSVGALLGGAVALRWRPARPLVAVFGLLVLWAPQFGLLAITAPVAAIAAASVVGQAAMSSVNAIWFTALQERIPPHARSRVSSYDWIGSMLFLPVGMALVGPISSSIGVTTTLLALSGWTVAASLFMLLLPSIRSFRREERAPSGEARAAVAS